MILVLEFRGLVKASSWKPAAATRFGMKCAFYCPIYQRRLSLLEPGALPLTEKVIYFSLPQTLTLSQTLNAIVTENL